MGLVIGILGLGLVVAIAYMLYLAVIIGGAILLTGLVLIVGIYVGLVDSIGPGATWSIIFAIGVGLTLFLLHKNAEQERIKTARLAKKKSSAPLPSKQNANAELPWMPPTKPPLKPRWQNHGMIEVWTIGSAFGLTDNSSTKDIKEEK